MKQDSPAIGLIIDYAFIWRDDAKADLEHGKPRPCMVLHIANKGDEKPLVYVVPISKVAPGQGHYIVLSPKEIKTLGLTEDNSRIITSEVNKFRWPSADILPPHPTKKRGRADAKIVEQARKQMKEKNAFVLDRDRYHAGLEKRMLLREQRLRGRDDHDRGR